VIDGEDKEEKRVRGRRVGGRSIVTFLNCGETSIPRGRTNERAGLPDIAKGSYKKLWSSGK